jgi:hypothetical protein
MRELNVVLVERFNYIPVMRKWGRIILAVAIFAVLGGLGWWALTPNPPDPVYNGHHLSYWVYLSEWPADGQIAVTLDSNSVPYLVQALKTKDGAPHKAYRYLYYRLPHRLQSHMTITADAWMVRCRACELLGTLGPNARPAISDLIRLLKESNAGTARFSAAWALGNIANRNDQTVVEALVAVTKENDPGTSFAAAEALKSINPEAGVK